MAHELTLRADGRADMAFADYSGTPWHGLGQRLTKEAPLGVWIKEAGLDWEAYEGVPIMKAGILGKADKYAEIEFPDYKALMRSDTEAPLAIVGAGYNVVQPRRCIEFFREMAEGGGWHIHTAGSLRGGRKVWAMASRGEWGVVGGGPRKSKGAPKDEVHNNLLFATSLDGSMKTTVVDTSVSVVCANTLAMALRDGDRTGKVITVSHRSVFDEEAVKKVLRLAGDSFARFMKQAQDLADTPCDVGEARELLDEIFGVKEKAAKAPDLSWMGRLADLGKQPEIPEESRVVGAVLDLFEGAGMGATLPSRLGTRWGLLNAVTEHVDHGMGRTDDTRLDGAWFGRGAQFKAKALELLVGEEAAA